MHILIIMNQLTQANSSINYILNLKIKSFFIPRHKPLKRFHRETFLNFNYSIKNQILMKKNEFCRKGVKAKKIIKTCPESILLSNFYKFSLWYNYTRI